MPSRFPPAVHALILAVGLAGGAGCGDSRAPGPDPEVARLLEEASAALGSGAGPARAADLYRAALALAAGSPGQRDDARYGLAQAELRAGRRWASEWNFARLAHESPGHAGALSAIGILAYDDERHEDAVAPLVELSRRRPLQGDEILALADSARLTNRLALADSLFTVHLAEQPDDVTALEIRGWVHRRRGNLAAAERDLARAVRLRPRSLPLAIAHAEVLLDLAREEEARAAIAALSSGFAAASPADSARAALLAARMALEEGRPQAALDLATRAASQDPDNLDAWQMKVRAHRARGDRAAARAAAAEHRERLRAIESAASALAVQRMTQAAIALEAADSTAAFAILQDALREDPEHLSSLALYAPLARGLEQRSESRAAFGKLRELSGGRVPGPIFLAVGQDLRLRGFPGLAATQFDLAAARLPGDEEPVFFAALARLEAEDEEGAYRTAAPLEAPSGSPEASP